MDDVRHRHLGQRAGSCIVRFHALFIYDYDAFAVHFNVVAGPGHDATSQNFLNHRSSREYVIILNLPNLPEDKEVEELMCFLYDCIDALGPSLIPRFHI